MAWSCHFLPFAADNNIIGRAGYMGSPAAASEDSGDENPTHRHRGSNLYQPLPEAVSDSERAQRRQPRLPRTGQVENAGNSGARVTMAMSAPLSSEYSIIRRQNLDRSLSPAQSLEDIPEEDEEESDSGQAIHAGYSVIRQEDMDTAYVSDSASDDGTEEVQGEGQGEELQDLSSRYSMSEMLGGNGEDTARDGVKENSDGDVERGDSGMDDYRRSEEEDTRVVSGEDRPRLPTPPQN